MSAGAFDSVYFRNVVVPSYGVWMPPSPAHNTFAHGLNENLPASEVVAGLEFWHRALIQLAE